MTRARMVLNVVGLVAQVVTIGVVCSALQYLTQTDIAWWQWVCDGAQFTLIGFTIREWLDAWLKD